MAWINKKDVLVHGFVREIENILSKNRIIPLGVIQICCAFYSIPIPILAVDRLKMHVVNIESKSLRNLLINTETHSDITEIVSSCYIPDISSYIKMNKDKSYDGIIGICNREISEDEFDTFHSCVILFESNHINNDNINCDLYVDDTTIPNYNIFMSVADIDLLYNNQNQKQSSVVYEIWDKIYELKLNAIDISSNKFNFNFLTDIPSFLMNGSDLSSGCIYNEDKIFIMQGVSEYWDFNFETLESDATPKTDVKLSCGIFDISAKQWSFGNDLVFNVNNETVEFGICKNNVYDTNIIYAVSNKGHITQYDIEQKNWTLMLEQDTAFQSKKKPMLWLDDNPYILYCSLVENTNIWMFDIRNNKSKWIKYNDVEFIEKSNQMDSESLVTRSFRLFF